MSLPTPYPIAPRPKGKLAINRLRERAPLTDAEVEEFLAEHEVPVIFVTWGFSWPHEAEGAQAVVSDAAQLRRLLLVSDDDAAASDSAANDPAGSDG